MDAQRTRSIGFGDFELDVRSGELRKHGLRIRLQDQSFQILLMLLERPGEVVLREEIRKKLWPNDTIVEFDHSINAAIKRLRNALGESAEEPRFIETLAKRGYRFSGAVNQANAPPPAATADPDNLSGKTFSHFRILEKLGSGGMGVVYRADDLKLGRQVALKFLQLPADELPGSVLERFEREARAASALNHPNICTVHSTENFGGQPVIVMEFLDGETLETRLARGPLAREEAVALAMQIAGALAEAHRKGIVHRDLKPANVMLTKSGVKVLDFGLAKIERPGDESARQPGVVMGTLRYMSPEQAQGKETDARSDIFSFGAVLYEMISGKRAFDGPDAILESQPPPVVPEALNRVVKACLAKDPADRFQSARDVQRALEWSGCTAIPTPARRQWIGWSVAAAAVLGVAALAFLRPAPQPEALRLAINPPPGLRFEFANNAGGSAISPDGRKVAFVAGDTLWVRPLDSETASKLSGTDGAYYPFWSPDQRSIAFFLSAKAKLMRIDLPSGPVTEIAALKSIASRGGSWNADGVIVYSEILRPLYRVPSTGGKPVQITSLDESRGENAHYHPCFLPDGDRYFYLIRSGDAANSGIYVGSLKDTKMKKRVAAAPSNAGYVAASQGYPGYLLFYREGALTAQPFDAKTLQSAGEQKVLSESAGYLFNNQFANFSVSGTGTVLLGTTGRLKVQMTWLDRRGNATAAAVPPDYFELPRVSPDGARVVAQRVSSQRTSPWIFDFNRGVLSRVDLDGVRPVWSADGRSIIYEGVQEKFLVRRNLDSPQPAEHVAQLDHVLGTDFDVSPDGRFAVAESDHGIAAYALGDRANSRQIPNLPGSLCPRFSHDGKWLAYSAPQSDRHEIFVQDFPEGRTRTQVSNLGGVVPLWRGDQKELFYFTRDGRVMAVDVRPGSAGLHFGTPHALFASKVLGAMDLGGTDVCDVTADGQRFLCPFPAETRDNQLTVLLNWRAAMR